MIRRFFFIRKRWFTLISIFLALSFICLSGVIKLLVTSLCIGVLWLHRRRDIQWRETLKIDGEMFLSPVDGEVVKIDQWIDPEAGFHYSELRLKIAHSDYWGLHLPSSGEMEFLKSYAGKSVPRKNLINVTTAESGPSSRTDMVLRSKNGIASRLRFLDCETGKMPRIWMKSGDRGRGAACFGYYPLGGSLIIYLPRPNDILVVENEKVTAGLTVLAVFSSQE